MTFTDPKERLRKIVSSALDGATYDSSTAEDDGSLLHIQARRQDGRRVNLVFRGVADSSATDLPPSGSSLRLRGVSSAKPFSLLGLFLFFMPRPPTTTMRVTIDAGDTRLTVVCEDADWWEE